MISVPAPCVLLLAGVLSWRCAESKPLTPIHGVCLPGYGLRKTHFNTTCNPCGTGSFSVGNTSLCLSCPAGYSSPMGATSCALCPTNFYEVKRVCLNCADPRQNVWADGSGYGWITSGPGATSLSQCFDLDLFIVFGWAFFLFVFGFATVFLVNGYVHTIAHFRHLRVSQACARVMSVLRKDIDAVLRDPRLDDDWMDIEVKVEGTNDETDDNGEDDDEDEEDAADAEVRRHQRQRAQQQKQQQKTKSTKKKRHFCVKVLVAVAQRVRASSRAILFIVFGAAFALFATMLAFVYQLTHVYFQGILMFRVLGNPAAADQLATFMNAWATGASLVLPFVGQLLTGPILAFLRFLLHLTLDLDISRVGINCYGAQAPFELLLNLTLFCVAVVMAQGNSCVLFSPLKTALMDKYAHLLHATRRRRQVYGVRAGLLVGILILGPLSNPVVPIVEYLLTMVTMNAFFSVGYHKSNPVCDARTMSGAVKADYVLAFLTSAFTYAACVAVAWVGAAVLYPKDAPELLRQRIARFRRNEYPRCCWHDDGVDPERLDEGGLRNESRTWTMYVLHMTANAISLCGMMFAVGFAYIDAILYVAFYSWARAVALKKRDVETAVTRTRDRLVQFFHAVRIPSRQHADWKYVDDALGRQLPSFTDFYRLWLCPRPMRRFKGRRKFPVPRPAPLPDLHLLAWRDVLYRYLAFLKVGFLGWDTLSLRELHVAATADALHMREVLDECPAEYFRDLCASLIVPRATLLRFVPLLTPVAFFIQQMATSPLLLPDWPLQTEREMEPPEGTVDAAPSTPKKARTDGAFSVDTDTATLAKPSLPLLSPSGLWTGTQRLLRGLPSPTQILSSPDSSYSSPTRSPLLFPSPASGGPGREAEAEVDDDTLQRRARRERRKRKRDHHLMLAYLEAQMREEREAEYVPPRWPQYLAAPYRLLHTSVLPTATAKSWWRYLLCKKEEKEHTAASSTRSFAGTGAGTGTGTPNNDAASAAAAPTGGFTWRYLVNLGTFVLSFWLAFGFAGFDSPALRGILIFLSFAVILPLAFAVSIRALIPIGHFFGVQDDDFLPLKGLLSTCQPGAWDGSSKASETTTLGFGHDSLVSSPSGVGMKRPHTDVDVDVEGGQGPRIHHDSVFK